MSKPFSAQKFVFGTSVLEIVELTADPSASGVSAPVGSIGLRDNSGAGEFWLKTGVADTAWTQGGGGGGGGGSGSGAHVAMSLSADITAPISANQAVAFNVQGDNLDLTLDTVTNVGRVSGLKAGKTYLLQAALRIFSTGSMSWCWYDVTGAAWIGNTAVINSANNFDNDYASALFTPSVDSSVELRFVDATAADVDAIYPTNGQPSTYATIIEVNGAADSLVARTELGAPATTLTLTGLDGDTDKVYRITGKLILSTAAKQIDMAPNGSGANLATKWSNNGGASSTDAAGQIANIGATTTSFVMIDFLFFVDRDGSYRGFSGSANVSYNGTNIDLNEFMGAYFDNTANLTSLDFISSAASGILAGSWVEVSRL